MNSVLLSGKPLVDVRIQLKAGPAPSWLRVELVDPQADLFRHGLTVVLAQC